MSAETASITPSVGAAIASLLHVLDVAKDVLHPDLRQHLQGVALYLHHQENEEVRRYTERLTGRDNGSTRAGDDA